MQCDIVAITPECMMIESDSHNDLKLLPMKSGVLFMRHPNGSDFIIFHQNVSYLCAKAVG